MPNLTTVQPSLQPAATVSLFILVHDVPVIGCDKDMSSDNSPRNDAEDIEEGWSVLEDTTTSLHSSSVLPSPRVKKQNDLRSSNSFFGKLMGSVYNLYNKSPSFLATILAPLISQCRLILQRLAKILFGC